MMFCFIVFCSLLRCSNTSAVFKSSRNKVQRYSAVTLNELYDSSELDIFTAITSSSLRFSQQKSYKLYSEFRDEEGKVFKRYPTNLFFNGYDAIAENQYKFGDRLISITLNDDSMMKSWFGQSNTCRWSGDFFNCEYESYCPKEIVVRPEDDVFSIDVDNPDLRLNWSPDVMNDSILLEISWHEGVTVGGSPAPTGRSNITIPDNGRLKVDSVLLKKFYTDRNIAKEKKAFYAESKSMQRVKFPSGPFHFEFVRSSYELSECNGKKIKNACRSSHMLKLGFRHN